MYASYGSQTSIPRPSGKLLTAHATDQSSLRQRERSKFSIPDYYVNVDGCRKPTGLT